MIMIKSGNELRGLYYLKRIRWIIPTSFASRVVSLSPLLNFSSFSFGVSPLSLCLKLVINGHVKIKSEGGDKPIELDEDRG